jgi:hypothetical protein
MPHSAQPSLSVGSLFAERDERRRREREAEEQLQQKQQEELAAFRQRLETFKVTPANVEAVLSRIRSAFDRGETELMLTSFPSSFCTDNGRAINNPDLAAPQPAGAATSDEPAWLATLPSGARAVYEHWRTSLRPGGFGFSARIINYPGGKPGDVGLFFTWPKSASDLPPGSGGTPA